MSYVVNNQPSKDTYTELVCFGAVKVNLQIRNAAVLIGFATSAAPGRAGVYSGDEYMAPVVGSLERRCDAIRFKSAVPGVPAQVTITAVTEGEGG